MTMKHQEDAPATMTMKIGSFNCGFTRPADLERIIATCVHSSKLDIFSMSEVGGHRHGLWEAGIELKNLHVVRAGSNRKGAQISESANYVSCWNFDEKLVRVDTLCKPHVISLKSTPVCEAQLQVQTFSYGKKATLLQGNLHIRTHGEVSKLTLKKIVQQALFELDKAKCFSYPSKELCVSSYCIVLYRIVSVWVSLSVCIVVLYRIVSYCILLYRIVSYCIVLYCFVSSCIVLYRLYGILSYCIVLHRIVSFCIVLYCIVSSCIVVYRIVM